MALVTFDDAYSLTLTDQTAVTISWLYDPMTDGSNLGEAYVCLFQQGIDSAVIFGPVTPNASYAWGTFSVQALSASLTLDAAALAELYAMTAGSSSPITPVILIGKNAVTPGGWSPINLVIGVEGTDGFDVVVEHLLVPKFPIVGYWNSGGPMRVINDALDRGAVAFAIRYNGADFQIGAPQYTPEISIGVGDGTGIPPDYLVDPPPGIDPWPSNNELEISTYPAAKTWRVSLQSNDFAPLVSSLAPEGPVPGGVTYQPIVSGDATQTNPGDVTGTDFPETFDISLSILNAGSVLIGTDTSFGGRGVYDPLPVSFTTLLTITEPGPGPTPTPSTDTVTYQSLVHNAFFAFVYDENLQPAMFKVPADGRFDVLAERVTWHLDALVAEGRLRVVPRHIVAPRSDPPSP